MLLVALALLGGAWLAFDRWMGRKEWEQYREAALARGEKLTFHDYAPPIVPPEENYITGTIFERMGVETSVEAEPRRPLKLPRPKPEPKATLIERVEATKATMLESGWLKKDDLPPEAGRAVLLGLERFRTELDELRAARSRPRSRFLQSELPPPKTGFPQVLLAMDTAALLALRIDAHLVVGDPTAAMEDLRDGLRLYHASTGEPTMISALGRQTLLHVLNRSVDSGLAARLWRQEDLEQMESLLAEIDLASDARQAFASERGFINDASLARGGLPIWEQVSQIEAMDVFGEEPRGWRLWLAMVSGDSWRRLVKQNRVLDHRLTQFWASLDGVFESAPPDDVTGEESFISMTGMIGKQYVTREMALRQTRVAIALERFRSARGSYPTTLEELVPKFISTIPGDVIDGQPVRYRRVEPDKFVLYSIGANGRDDEGSAVQARGPGVGVYKALDWVWGEPWK